MPSADLCSAVRPPFGSLSRRSDTKQISWGKLSRLPCTVAESTLRALDGCDLPASVRRSREFRATAQGRGELPWRHYGPPLPARLESASDGRNSGIRGGPLARHESACLPAGGELNGIGRDSPHQIRSLTHFAGCRFTRACFSTHHRPPVHWGDHATLATAAASSSVAR